MKKRRIIIAVISLIYICFFVICCYSGPVRSESDTALPAVDLSLLGAKKVRFAAGSFSVDSTELTVVLESGETALLDQFTELQSADFSGSTCYEEIAAWAAEHPEISVRYTIPLPDGSVLDNSAQAVDLSGFDGESVSQAAALLGYLPQLTEINLGSASAERSVSADTIAVLRESCPSAVLKYTASIAGQTLDISAQSLSLGGISHDEAAFAAAFLACMPELSSADLGYEGDEGLTWEDIGLFQSLCPEVNFSYAFSLFGQDLNISDETLDFNHITMDDEGAAVRSILPYMKNCTYLDMDFCNVSNEAMASIREDYPNIKVVWRIWFGSAYSVRTDVEKILASKPTVGGNLTDSQVDVLKYCSDLKYLDLGHNEAITDLSFVYGMPNLEVLIIAMNPVSDLTPLASCPKLEFLGMHSTSISDLSPLSGLTELRHLNIANCPDVTDISPLYGLTDLERLWIGCIDPVPAEQVEHMQECAPDCEIDTTVYDPEAGRWRVIGYTELSLQLYAETGWLQEILHPRYELLREQFGYATEDYSFYWLDPKY